LKLSLAGQPTSSQEGVDESVPSQQGLKRLAGHALGLSVRVDESVPSQQGLKQGDPSFGGGPDRGR